MRPWTIGIVLAAAMELGPAAAQSPTGDAGGSAADGDDELVAVVEPGKPMRFEVRSSTVAMRNGTGILPAPPPEPEQETGGLGGEEPCLLDGPVDRRATPTTQCTRCHDGPSSRSHRVNIAYSTGGRLRENPEQFNPKVVLMNGTITCMTCHDSASTELMHLALPTSGPVDQRLCVACHPFQ